MTTRDFFESTKDKFAEMFIAERRKEFDIYSAAMENDNQVSSRLRGLNDRLANLEEIHASLVENVTFFADGNLGLAAYNMVRQNGHPVINFLELAASQLLTADFIKRHAAEILAASEKEVAAHKALIAEFTKNNAAALKRINRVEEP